MSSPPSDRLTDEEEEHTTTTATYTEQGKVVLILCGLIASGKSTFAEALQEFCPEFRRCNQDDLGDRRRVEQLARESLNQGLSVCIDRTNFNAVQRSYWTRIANEFPETEIWVLVFDTPYETCAARLQTRTSHPTITDPEQGLSILARFASDFEFPHPQEGFDRIAYLKPTEYTFPVSSRTEVMDIIGRVRQSPRIPRLNPIGNQSPSGRGHNRGSWRGTQNQRGSTSENNRGVYRGRGGWGQQQHNNYYGVPSGRGTSFAAGPSRGGQPHATHYRGNGTLSAQRGGQGLFSWRRDSRATEIQDVSSEIARSSEGTQKDPLAID